MIKLVVTDVDGTLVEDGSPNIDPELFETILKLREKGIQKFLYLMAQPP